MTAIASLLRAGSLVSLSLQLSPIRRVLWPEKNRSQKKFQKKENYDAVTCACSFQISSCSCPKTSNGGGIWAERIPAWLSESSEEIFPRFFAAAARSRLDFSKSSRVTCDQSE
jgi:hypothetical protein